MSWTAVIRRLPEDTGEEHSYLITDGHEISIGWYQPEYFAESPEEHIQYESDAWHDDANLLNTCISGFPEVTHWAILPKLPGKK